MPRTTIQQCRATLAGRAEPGALVRACREITRRPGVALGAGFATWGDWSGPPAASRS